MLNASGECLCLKVVTDAYNDDYTLANSPCCRENQPFLAGLSITTCYF